ncbi:hypothetical protein T06_1943, partial [Trichinella sp. T6]
MDLFRYSNLVTPGETITVICENAIMSIHCTDPKYFISLPCIGQCHQRGNDSFCKTEFIVTKPINCKGSNSSQVLVLDNYLEDSNRYCKSCDATNSSKLMFSYTYFYHYNEYLGFLTQHVSCNSLIKCEETYEVEDVPPVVYYEDGDFHPTSHCSILTKDIVDIP